MRKSRFKLGRLRVKEMATPIESTRRAPKKFYLSGITDQRARDEQAIQARCRDLLKEIEGDFQRMPRLHVPSTVRLRKLLHQPAARTRRRGVEGRMRGRRRQSSLPRPRTPPSLPLISAPRSRSTHAVPPPPPPACTPTPPPSSRTTPSTSPSRPMAAPSPTNPCRQEPLPTQTTRTCRTTRKPCTTSRAALPPSSASTTAKRCTCVYIPAYVARPQLPRARAR